MTRKNASQRNSGDCRFFISIPPPGDAPDVSPLPAATTGEITFASFNNPSKVNSDVISLWADVLKAVSGSKLLLKYRNFLDQPSLRQRWITAFGEHGIGEDRLIFGSSVDNRTEHLALYHRVDMALDTFPFNGATTTFEALWMGVPVISLMGGSFISRAAGSLLTHAGHPEWAAENREAYVAAAVELAGDIARLAEIRAGLRAEVAESKLCDSGTYTSTVEAAYRDMWKKYCLSQEAGA